MKIAFWDNSLSERGTSVALYDYAHFNETLLGNKSVVFYCNKRGDNHSDVIHKFTKRFDKVYAVDDFKHVDAIIQEEQCDFLYIIKSGEWDEKVSAVVPTGVHCVFNCRQPHGTVYAGISPFIRGMMNEEYECLYHIVPHMVHLPKVNGTMRAQLGIPESATVFGRYGGHGQFDIPYVQDTIIRVAETFPHKYFVFVNTEDFVKTRGSPKFANILFLTSIVDPEKKAEFIETCDAMVWGRSDGETFGLSIAEFSIKNKPVFLTQCGFPAHQYFMREKGIWYDKDTLYDLLCTFDKDSAKGRDWNAFREYTPEIVMRQFSNVFLSKVSERNV